MHSVAAEAQPVSYLTLDDPVCGQLNEQNVLAP